MIPIKRDGEEEVHIRMILEGLQGNENTARYDPKVRQLVRQEVKGNQNKSRHDIQNSQNGDVPVGRVTSYLPTVKEAGNGDGVEEDDTTTKDQSEHQEIHLMFKSKRREGVF